MDSQDSGLYSRKMTFYAGHSQSHALYLAQMLRVLNGLLEEHQGGTSQDSCHSWFWIMQVDLQKAVQNLRQECSLSLALSLSLSLLLPLSSPLSPPNPKGFSSNIPLSELGLNT